MYSEPSRLLISYDDYMDENKSEDGWSGFHRIECIMWQDNTTEGTAAYVDQLVNDIKELKAKIATVKVTPDIMLTGAVDLLNEVATQKITGEEEVFSHTDLYDFRANIEGAEKIFEDHVSHQALGGLITADVRGSRNNKLRIHYLLPPFLISPR